MFVSTAALKVAAGSLGTGLAGALAPLGPRLLVAGASIALAAAVAASVSARRRVDRQDGWDVDKP